MSTNNSHLHTALRRARPSMEQRSRICATARPGGMMRRIGRTGTLSCTSPRTLGLSMPTGTAAAAMG
eukprot:CAMPEP_0204517102 /NCGR_PEP_ID=MMETSP0661-20131031/3492_1 /ASSEMBLY_ACC=CAM_ASM_000606 /TAXON_ID=109239 /ORGANISM="Alexandrium margalefi, Strain AMGDE01CS-322" /LENGTH=66 /DNA_ID=CAMNT_0051522487 /DNA_START=309 /DNA_END=509 /DNA_ORIENTATION=+